MICYDRSWYSERDSELHRPQHGFPFRRRIRDVLSKYAATREFTFTVQHRHARRLGPARLAMEHGARSGVKLRRAEGTGRGEGRLVRARGRARHGVSSVRTAKQTYVPSLERGSRRACRRAQSGWRRRERVHTAQSAHTPDLQALQDVELSPTVRVHAVSVGVAAAVILQDSAVSRLQSTRFCHGPCLSSAANTSAAPILVSGSGSSISRSTLSAGAS